MWYERSSFIRNSRSQSSRLEGVIGIILRFFFFLSVKTCIVTPIRAVLVRGHNMSLWKNKEKYLIIIYVTLFYLEQ